MFGAAILLDDQNWRNDSNTTTGNRREDGEQHAALRSQKDIGLSAGGDQRGRGYMPQQVAQLVEREALKNVGRQ